MTFYRATYVRAAHEPWYPLVMVIAGRGWAQEVQVARIIDNFNLTASMDAATGPTQFPVSLEGAVGGLVTPQGCYQQYFRNY